MIKGLTDRLVVEMQTAARQCSAATARRERATLPGTA
jgi:hypothetical protein